MAKIKLADGSTSAKKEKKKLELSRKTKIIIGSCVGAAVIVVCSIFFAKDYKKIEDANAYTIEVSDPAMLFNISRDESYDEKYGTDTEE